MYSVVFSSDFRAFVALHPITQCLAEPAHLDPRDVGYYIKAIRAVESSASHIIPNTHLTTTAASIKSTPSSSYHACRCSRFIWPDRPRARGCSSRFGGGRRRSHAPGRLRCRDRFRSF
jgi:hypothetical protein